jgi:hypothetical protein
MGYHALNRFRGFDTSSTDELRGEMGARTMGRIGEAVQVQSIADLLCIGELAHFIEASGIFLHRLTQEGCLLWRWLQLDTYRACRYHVHVVPQWSANVNNSIWHSTPMPKPQERKTCFLPMAQARGFRRSQSDEQV